MNLSYYTSLRSALQQIKNSLPASMSAEEKASACARLDSLCSLTSEQIWELMHADAGNPGL